MDAAIEAWWKCLDGVLTEDIDQHFKERLEEIRDWLMNEKPPRDYALCPEGAADQ